MISQYLTEARKTVWLSLPFIVNLLLQISVAVVDTMMAGTDGELTLAAVSQGASLLIVIQLIIIGLAMPLTPMVAKSFSQKNHRLMRETFHQGVWLSLILGCLGLILMLIAPVILHVAGVKATIIPPATDYLMVLAIAMPCYALYLPVRFFNEGIGNPKIVMYITALSIPINVVGNYVFLHGLWGFPKMGATGVALSSVLSIIFICIVGWIVLYNQNTAAPYRLFSAFSTPVKKTLYRFIRLGFPNAVALFMEEGMFACISLLSGRLGVIEAAANQIVYIYIASIFMVPLGISLAVMTRVGMAVGENNIPKVRIIGLSGMMLGASITLMYMIVILLFGNFIVSMYTNNEVVIHVAAGLLAMAALFQIPDGIQVCGSGALRGLEETKAPMLYAIIGYWVLPIPCSIWLAFYTDLSVKGLWIGLLVGLSVTSVFCVRKFLRITAPSTA